MTSITKYGSTLYIGIAMVVSILHFGRAETTPLVVAEKPHALLCVYDSGLDHT